MPSSTLDYNHQKLSSKSLLREITIIPKNKDKPLHKRACLLYSGNGWILKDQLTVHWSGNLQIHAKENKAIIGSER